MQYIFELSKENLKLASAEALALNSTKKYKLVSNLLFTDSAEDYDRLAYTKGVYLYLGTDIDKIDWQKYYKGPFRIRAKGMDEREIANNVWNKLKSPKVDLEHPKTKIVVLNKKYYCIQLYENEERFFERRTQFRPEPHPSSMSPKLARAMVNLTGAKKGETLLDPFCGSGGILIEAGFAGLKLIGSDLDKIMIERAKINLKHYKLSAKLSIQDARKIKGSYDYIATDLPYGLSTKVDDVKQLLFDFLKNINAKHLIVGLPNFIKPVTLLKKNKYKVKAHFTYYVHKSLTKELFILEK
jgi:tRNA (guanine10-N2)-dimethyltransferase